MEPKKVLHITNIASLYRQAQWSKLLAHPRLDYHFAFGDNPYAGIKTIDFSVSPFTKFKASLHGIKNIWVFKKFLVWQRGVIGKCLKTNANLVILLGEFNVLSNWIGALICRIRKVPVVFRGHGMYGNEKGLKLFLRKNYYKLANGHLVYERRSKKIMVSHGFKAENIHIIFNSLDYDAHREARERIKNLDKAEIYPFFKNPEAPVLLFVGRLTTVKKLHLFLEAVAILNKKGHYPNILIVGDGPEGPELKKYATQHLKEGYYHFYGACYNEKTNEKISVLVQLLPTGRDRTLLPNIQLSLISKKGRTLQTTTSHSRDNYIQLKSFKGKAGMQFSLKVQLDDAIVTENFEI